LKIQGICVICNKNKQENKGKAYGYRKVCGVCNRSKYKKDCCENCGFIPKHLCQLDVHHIDENHFNNAISNLKTLCANCHRLQHIKFL